MRCLFYFPHRVFLVHAASLCRHSFIVTGALLQIVEIIIGRAIVGPSDGPSGSPFSEKIADLVGSYIVTKCHRCWLVHCCTSDVHSMVVGDVRPIG